jgi:hypothetical protein
MGLKPTELLCIFGTVGGLNQPELKLQNQSLLKEFQLLECKVVVYSGGSNRHFGGTCRLHLQDRKVSQARNQHVVGCNKSSICLSASFLPIFGCIILNPIWDTFTVSCQEIIIRVEVGQKMHKSYDGLYAFLRG